jgi:hypothetical protein
MVKRETGRVVGGTAGGESRHLPFSVKQSKAENGRPLPMRKLFTGIYALPDGGVNHLEKGAF